MITVWAFDGWYKASSVGVYDITTSVVAASFAYFPGEKTGGQLTLRDFDDHDFSVWSSFVYVSFKRGDGLEYTLFSGIVTNVRYDAASGDWVVTLEPLESLLDRQHLTAGLSLSGETQAAIGAALMGATLPLCHTVDAGSVIERDRTYDAYDSNSVLTLLLNLSEVINGPDWFTYFADWPVTIGDLTYPRGYSLVIGDDLSTGDPVAIDTTYLVDAQIEYSGGNDAYQSTVVALSRNEDAGDLVAVASRALPAGAPPAVLIDSESNSTQQAALDERAEGLLSTYSDGVTSIDLTYSMDILWTDTSPVPLPLMYYKKFNVQVPVAGTGYQTMTCIYGGCSYEFGSNGWLIKPRLQVVN